MAKRQDIDRHIVGYRTFLAVWAILLACTAATVAVSRVALSGGAAALASLSIATLKAGLVLFFFMHIKWEPRFIRVMLLVALFALSVILLLTFSDVWFRGSGG